MKLPVDLTKCSRPALTVVLSVAALAVLGCGGDEGGGKEGRFEVSAKVDHYAGPTPLISRVKASSKNAKGDVIYRWRFDDGTSSRKPELTHKFERAGYYQVTLDARDESGNNAQQSFLFGAWPPGFWAKSQTTPLTQKGALRTQKVQQARTDKRRKELRRVLRRRANEQVKG